MGLVKNSKTKKGAVAKVLITFVLLFLSGLGTLIYSVYQNKTLILYPNLKGEIVEMLVKSDDETLNILERYQSLSADDLVKIHIQFAEKKKATQIIPLKQLDLEQKDCPKKWDCPVMIMSKEKFYKEVLKL